MWRKREQLTVLAFYRETNKSRTQALSCRDKWGCFNSSLMDLAVNVNFRTASCRTSFFSSFWLWESENFSGVSNFLGYRLPDLHVSLKHMLQHISVCLKLKGQTSLCQLQLLTLHWKIAPSERGSGKCLLDGVLSSKDKKKTSNKCHLSHLNEVCTVTNWLQSKQSIGPFEFDSFPRQNFDDSYSKFCVCKGPPLFSYYPLALPQMTMWNKLDICLMDMWNTLCAASLWEFWCGRPSGLHSYP